MAAAVNSVRVDNDFARFGSKSYAINKINSVEVRERQPHGMGVVILSGFFAVVLFFVGIQTGNATSIAVGVILGLLAIWLWTRTRIREYLLFLMTSSSETQAFMTRDEEEVDSLREQIEAAMLNHSRRGASI